jgi:uncharacterized protein YegJ (DUF2314 family)
MRRLGWLSILLFVTLGCGFLSGAGNDPIVEVANNDPEMIAAIEDARNTLYFFLENFQSPKPNQTYFSIKARFPYGADSHEHMWIDDLIFSGQEFSGILGNDPRYVLDLKYGDKVTVKVSDVTDWMIVENGKLIGGYTLLVLRNRMSPTEREKFDAQIGLVIDPNATPIPTAIP